MAKRYDKYAFTGAVVIIEEYLEGAIYDYENNDFDNDFVIMSCIELLKYLGWSYEEYLDRMNKAKAKREANK